MTTRQPVLRRFLKSTNSHHLGMFRSILFHYPALFNSSHDVLIFLTGQEEIETVAHQIRQLSHDPEVDGPPIRVCTLYAAQSTMTQAHVFQPAPSNVRKVVISTNIAETSVTISGIRYVIDSGMVKVR